MEVISASQTLAAIDTSIEADQDNAPGRLHFGASIAGEECSRKLWYGHHWVKAQRHSARLLRLFARGETEEVRFVNFLRRAGVAVWEVDPDTNQQWRIEDHAGHFGGSLDGMGKGLPDAPDEPHVLEFKTHNAKSFADLVKRGVYESKPMHYTQMQIYMHKMDVQWALYMAVNKNDDDLYLERVPLDQAHAQRMLDRAGRIITSDRPLERMSDDPSWFKCKWCDFYDLCHGTATPAMNCRTCAHATPTMDGDGRWHCEKHDRHLDKASQRNGCDDHNFIPPLLANWAEPIDADGDGVTYRNKLTGNEFVNGAAQYRSDEIASVESPEMIGDATTDAIKSDFDARLAAEAK